MLLVTGGSGFLGSSIVELAGQAGRKTRIFNRTAKGDVKDSEIVVGDLSDVRTVRKACEGVSTIIHAAGLAHVFGSKFRDLSSFTLANEVGTENLVTAALDAGVAHIVLVSTVAVYGATNGATLDETANCSPVGPYAVSKWRAERRATERLANSEVRLTILRFSTMYGIGDSGNVARLIRLLARGRFIGVGTGLNRKSLIYQDDAARACLAAAWGSGPHVGTFNVSGPSPTMKEIVSSICEALGRPAPRVWIPGKIVKLASRVSGALGDPFQVDHAITKFMRDDSYSGAKFEQRYGFRTSVSVSEGMRNEVAWLINGARK